LIALAIAFGGGGTAAQEPSGSNYLFATPVFGIDTALDGSLLVADAGAGIVRLNRRGRGALIAELPGVTDVAPAWFGLLAVTGGTTAPGPPPPLARKLFRVVHGRVTQLADFQAFEEAVNPAGGIVDSNPFDVQPLWNGSALVADAAANALLVVDHKGRIDWVATFPPELVPTDNVKELLGCPMLPPPPEPDPQNPCHLPPMIPAEAVPTSVAIGIDGAYYVGELKGFPAPTGQSRVWRIKPGARHVRCGESPACTVVADGFTSIIDLSFGWGGTMHVVELDEASWFAVEVTHTPRGGTVNKCRRGRGTREWACDVEAAGLIMPTAATVDFHGRLRVVTNALIPGAAEVITVD
jgi:hypothetical protein